MGRVLCERDRARNRDTETEIIRRKKREKKESEKEKSTKTLLPGQSCMWKRQRQIQRDNKKKEEKKGQ